MKISTQRQAQAAQFNLVAVGQKGRLEYEALLLAASLRASAPAFSGRFFVAEPQPGPLWKNDPRMSAATRDRLVELGAEILPFEAQHFGQSYPHGNKIEVLFALPADEPFLFLDTDTLILGPIDAVPFDFQRPAASMRREGTWPQLELYGPGYTQIWKSLYDRFGLDFESSLDPSQPDEFWERYLYFNAGWFLGACPRVFGQRFLDYALSIRNDPPPELVLQPLEPWLDQVALPLVIHALGGGRPGLEISGLDGAVTCHYRVPSLLYARESDAAVAMLEQLARDRTLKPLLREWEALRRLVYQGKGMRIRAMFDRAALPRREAMIRNRLKAEGLWFR